MVGRQVLVRGVVLERAVQHLAQHPGLDQPGHGVEKRVVPLHEIGDQQPVLLPGSGDQLVGLATVMASGFSTITCLPASRAAIACEWWRNGGVAM